MHLEPQQRKVAISKRREIKTQLPKLRLMSMDFANAILLLQKSHRNLNREIKRLEAKYQDLTKRLKN